MTTLLKKIINSPIIGLDPKDILTYTSKIRKLCFIFLFVTPLLVLIFLLFSADISKSLNINQSIKISEVEVDYQKSIWNNIIKKQKIIGFSYDEGYLYDNWGWGLFLQQDSNGIEQYEKHSKQLLMIKSFKNYLKIYFKTSLMKTIIDSEDDKIIELLNLNEREFLKVVLESYWGNQDLLKYIKKYLPSDNKVEELKTLNSDDYKILNDFYHAFYRDYFPIFNFLLTNNSDENIVVHSTFIEFKNIIICSQDGSPSPSDEGVLDLATAYEWDFDIFENKNFNYWYQHYSKLPTSTLNYNIRKLFNANDAMHYVYKKKIISNKLNLEPQLIIPPNDAIRFRAKLKHNNGMPCKIRFNIIYNDNKIIKSDWYTFSQTFKEYH